ncbi:MAG TPA: hypothetical protein VJ719_12210 [Chthoniobacterales bacterium]|nr:hypothetical protein [Chthoniobacterales bacterium]
MSSPNWFHQSDRMAFSRNQVCSLRVRFISSAVVTVVALALVSVRIADGCPGVDPAGATSSVLQPAVTTAVIDGVSRPVAIEMAYIYPSLSLEEILRRFSDARIDPAERRAFAYRLA